MDALTLVLFLVGLVLLTFGADYLVKGAAHLAGRMGISPLIIGLTVVAFGTSAPELAVSIDAAFSGRSDIALGNVVGSNICNVLLILGISALAAPLVVDRQLVRVDVPVMIGMTLLVAVFALDGRLTRGDGAVLFAGLIAYVLLLRRIAQRDKARAEALVAEADVEEAQHSSPWLSVAQVIGGLVMLVVGANWLVDGAVSLARMMGLSELVIGLTIVAIGTSLPELATSVMASLKGQRDIAIGNIVGSNIFNILAVLGISSLISPTGVGVAEAAVAFDIPVMILVALFCLPLFLIGYEITRLNGLLLLVWYGLYTAYLIFNSNDPAFAVALKDMMVTVALPLTALWLSVGLWRQRRSAA